MATIEIRVFGSKKHLLVTPTESELPLVRRALGVREHTRFDGEIVLDDFFQVYLRLQKKNNE